MESNSQFGPTDKTNFSLEMGNNKHGFRMILITLVVVIIAVVGYMAAKNGGLQQMLKGGNTNTQNPSETSVPEEFVPPAVSTITNRQIPWVEVTPDSGNTATVGQPFSFTVKAFSGGNDIAGYDLLLAIDPAQFEVQSINSVLPSFGITQTNRPTHIAITAIKDFGQNDQTILDNTPILKVTVKPLKAGSATISVFTDHGKEKTQLVNTNVTPVPPQVGSMQVTVQ